MSGPWLGAFMTLAVLVILMGVVVLGLLRRMGSVLERTETLLMEGGSGLPLEGLPAGTELPFFEAKTTQGERITDSDFIGMPSLFLFVDEDCHPCKELLAELSLVEQLPPTVRVVVAIDSKGERPAHRLPEGVLLVDGTDQGLAQTFRSSIRPNAVGVDPSGTVIGHTIPNSVDDLWTLMRMWISPRSDTDTFRRMHGEKVRTGKEVHLE
jgi:thiol-disulfide isomerase/thioredoxin